jgi:translocation and assembly module TamB
VSKHIRKSLLWIGAVVALSSATAMLIIGTESGSRWLLDRVSGSIPGLIVDEINGTLLTSLEIGHIGYKTPKFTITLARVEINPSWSRSSLRQLTMQDLTVSEFRYLRLAADSTEAKPLDIPVPNIPISLLADNVSVQSIFIGEKVVTDASASMLKLDDDSLRAVAASASFARVETSVSNFIVQFDDKMSIESGLEWRYLNGEWSGRASVDGSLRQLRFQHELLLPMEATAVGSISLLQQTEPLIDAVVHFADWQNDEWTVAAGELAVQGTINDYRGTATARVKNADSLSADIQVKGSGNFAGIDDVKVSARSPLGLVLALGSLAWSPEPVLELQITGEGINLADYLPVAPGNMAVEISLLAKSPTNFTVDVASLNGTYNDQPIGARGSFSIVDNVYRCTACEVFVGQNNVTIDGSLDDRDLAATFVLDATSLEQLWPDLAGSVTANGTLQGSVKLPMLSVSASGESVSWNDWRVGSFTADSRMIETDDIYLQLDIHRLSRGDALLGSGQMLAEGGSNAIDMRTDWSVGELIASARGTIALGDDTVAGSLSGASVYEPYSGIWALAGPLEFSVAAEELQIAANSWVNGDAVVQNERLLISDGEVQTGATLSNIPLAIASHALPENIRLDGRANASVSVSRVDKLWSGNLSWDQTDTDVWLAQQGDQEIQIGVPIVKVEARLDASGATARAEFELDPGLDGLLEFSMDDLSPEARLSARLQLSGDEWDWVPALLPEIDNVQGKIDADISMDGQLNSPQLRGGLRWQQGTLAIPSLNAPLTDIDVTVTASSADEVKITGNAMAGSGTLLLDGRLENITDSSRSFTVEITGEGAQLLNWPDYQVTASPDIVISGNTATVEITGKLQVDKAEIAVNELPEGAVQPSADVVVSGETTDNRSGLSLTGDVEMILSESVHIEAFGLDSKLEGDLRITQLEPGNPLAHGELELKDGLFGAYGQQLQIEKGTLTFTGPIDDPIVNVRAVREIDSPSGTIMVGIELNGRAQDPSSTLFSSPTMSETEILSYLVIGRSLQDASAADGNTVADSAFALGVRQAALITHQIGQSLGLDELAIEGSNQSTISLVAGKQLNSRLYARYAYGVFARIGNLLLRYKLNERFTIEVGAGDSQSMDLLYIIEKK